MSSDLVRVEVVTSMLVPPEQAADSAWRDSLLQTQQAFGSVAAEGTEVRLEVTFNSQTNGHYGGQLAKEAADTQRAKELAGLDPAVLGMDMLTLLTQAGGREPRPTKLLAGELRNNGLGIVRGLLAAGSAAVERGYAGSYSEPRRAVIDLALASVGAAMPKAPSAADIALFCDGLDQVPGYALIRTAQETGATELEKKKHEAGGMACFFFDLDLFDKPVLGISAWAKADLLKYSIGRLRMMSEEELANAIAVGNGFDRINDQEDWALRSAQLLQRVTGRFATEFAAAAEARSN